MDAEVAKHLANMVVGSMIDGVLEALGGSLSLVGLSLSELSNAENAAVADAVDAILAAMKASESAVDEYMAGKTTP